MKHALLVTLLVLLACMGLLSRAGAQEASVTLQSTVSGDQEQPRVMYIVPWQQPGAAAYDYELENTIADELFAPVDRDEFVRGLVYRHRLDQRAAERLGSAAALPELN